VFVLRDTVFEYRQLQIVNAASPDAALSKEGEGSGDGTDEDDKEDVQGDAGEDDEGFCLLTLHILDQGEDTQPDEVVRKKEVAAAAEGGRKIGMQTVLYAMEEQLVAAEWRSLAGQETKGIGEGAGVSPVGSATVSPVCSPRASSAAAAAASAVAAADTMVAKQLIGKESGEAKALMAFLTAIAAEDEAATDAAKRYNSSVQAVEKCMRRLTKPKGAELEVNAVARVEAEVKVGKTTKATKKAGSGSTLQSVVNIAMMPVTGTVQVTSTLGSALGMAMSASIGTIGSALAMGSPERSKGKTASAETEEEKKTRLAQKRQRQEAWLKLEQEQQDIAARQAESSQTAKKTSSAPLDATIGRSTKEEVEAVKTPAAGRPSIDIGSPVGYDDEPFSPLPMWVDGDVEKGTDAAAMAAAAAAARPTLAVASSSLQTMGRVAMAPAHLAVNVTAGALSMTSSTLQLAGHAGAVAIDVALSPVRSVPYLTQQKQHTPRGRHFRNNTGTARLAAGAKAKRFPKGRGRAQYREGMPKMRVYCHSPMIGDKEEKVDDEAPPESQSHSTSEWTFKGQGWEQGNEGEVDGDEEGGHKEVVESADANEEDGEDDGEKNEDSAKLPTPPPIKRAVSAAEEMLRAEGIVIESVSTPREKPKELVPEADKEADEDEDDGIDNSTSCLHVNIVSAVGLPYRNRNASGKAVRSGVFQLAQDPYIQVLLLEKKDDLTNKPYQRAQQTLPVRGGGANPKWGESEQSELVFEMERREPEQPQKEGEANAEAEAEKGAEEEAKGASTPAAVDDHGWMAPVSVQLQVWNAGRVRDQLLGSVTLQLPERWELLGHKQSVLQSYPLTSERGDDVGWVQAQVFCSGDVVVEQVEKERARLRQARAQKRKEQEQMLAEASGDESGGEQEEEEADEEEKEEGQVEEQEGQEKRKVEVQDEKVQDGGQEQRAQEQEQRRQRDAALAVAVAEEQWQQCAKLVEKPMMRRLRGLSAPKPIAAVVEEPKEEPAADVKDERYPSSSSNNSTPNSSPASRTRTNRPEKIPKESSEARAKRLYEAKQQRLKAAGLNYGQLKNKVRRKCRGPHANESFEKGTLTIRPEDPAKAKSTKPTVSRTTASGYFGDAHSSSLLQRLFSPYMPPVDFSRGCLLVRVHGAAGLGAAIPQIKRKKNGPPPLVYVVATLLPRHPHSGAPPRTACRPILHERNATPTGQAKEGFTVAGPGDINGEARWGGRGGSLGPKDGRIVLPLGQSAVAANTVAKDEKCPPASRLALEVWCADPEDSSRDYRLGRLQSYLSAHGLRINRRSVMALSPGGDLEVTINYVPRGVAFVDEIDAADAPEVVQAEEDAEDDDDGEGDEVASMEAVVSTGGVGIDSSNSATDCLRSAVQQKEQPYPLVHVCPVAPPTNLEQLMRFLCNTLSAVPSNVGPTKAGTASAVPSYVAPAGSSWLPMRPLRRNRRAPIHIPQHAYDASSSSGQEQLEDTDEAYRQLQPRPMQLLQRTAHEPPDCESTALMFYSSHTPQNGQATAQAASAGKEKAESGLDHRLQSRAITMNPVQVATALGLLRARLLISPAVTDAALVRFFSELCCNKKEQRTLTLSRDRTVGRAVTASAEAESKGEAEEGGGVDTSTLRECESPFLNFHCPLYFD
jgi:hypothetical protein